MRFVQFKLNLPLDVKAWLEVEARKNVRSQGAQIVMCLKAAMGGESEVEMEAVKHDIHR